MTSRLKSESSTWVFGMNSWLQPTQVTSASAAQRWRETDKGFTGVKTPASVGLFRRAHTAKSSRAGQAGCASPRLQPAKCAVLPISAVREREVIDERAARCRGEQECEAALLGRRHAARLERLACRCAGLLYADDQHRVGIASRDPIPRHLQRLEGRPSPGPDRVRGPAEAESDRNMPGSG